MLVFDMLVFGGYSSGCHSLTHVSHLDHLQVGLDVPAPFRGVVGETRRRGFVAWWSFIHTVDGSEIPFPTNHREWMVLKACKSWEKLPFPQLVSWISEPSTVLIHLFTYH